MRYVATRIFKCCLDKLSFVIFEIQRVSIRPGNRFCKYEVHRGQIIAVTGGLESPLAEAADVTLDAGVKEEGGPLDMAPRASVAAEVLVLAALGAVLQERKGLDRTEYAARHPAGALGKQARGD